jgi:tetratricopeptide (TPR) repeat protein
MTNRRTPHPDPMKRMIENALRPGHFIGWREADAFSIGLRQTQVAIAALMKSRPERTVALYETFIAGCAEKADEVDGSDGEFGAFAGGLFCGWIKARQAAGADRTETARLLLAWMDDDPYAFCHDLERGAVKVLDREGLKSFEQAVRVRFDEASAAPGQPEDHARDYQFRRWGTVLKTIYAAQRDIEKYLDLTAQAGLGEADYETIAAMYQAKRKPLDALEWVERGLKIDQRSGFKLGRMRRKLLVQLDRGGEALDSAWEEFAAHPDKFTYDELMRYVPKPARGAWHEKAMAASEKGELGSLIELWLGTKEIGRLAERLDSAGNTELDRLSHDVAELAAERLARTHPAVAAKVFRAVGMHTIDAGDSEHYDAALSNLEKAMTCYRKAGLDAQWNALVAEIRGKHRRKTSLMPGFEKLVAGVGPSREPAFLDRARKRWNKLGRA